MPIYTGLVDFLNRHIPSIISINGREYQFQLFINHAHYDIRIGYINDDADPGFMFLYENIASDGDLFDTILEMREALRKAGILTGDYATEEGYTFEKFCKFMDGEETF